MSDPRPRRTLGARAGLRRRELSVRLGFETLPYLLPVLVLHVLQPIAKLRLWKRRAVRQRVQRIDRPDRALRGVLHRLMNGRAELLERVSPVVVGAADAGQTERAFSPRRVEIARPGVVHLDVESVRGLAVEGVDLGLVPRPLVSRFVVAIGA